jgi:hypothetical protein
VCCLFVNWQRRKEAERERAVITKETFDPDAGAASTKSNRQRPGGLFCCYLLSRGPWPCGAADMDGYVAVALGDDAPTPHPVQSSSPLPSGKGGPRPLRARLAREFLSGGSMCHGLRVFCFGSSVRSSKRVMIRIHKRTDHIRLLLYKSQASFPFFSFFFLFLC